MKIRTPMEGTVRMLHKNHTYLKLVVSIILFMLVVAPLFYQLVYADGNEDDGEGGEAAEGLGSVAAWGGVILIGGFVIFREAYMRFLRQARIVKPEMYKNAITFHAITSILLGIIGVYHGYTLQRYAGPVEYALVSVIIFTLITGSMLWLSRGKLRRYIRLIHVQRVLAITILILLILHTSLIGD